MADSLPVSIVAAHLELAVFSAYCGREVYIDNSVFMSERLTLTRHPQPNDRRF